MEGPLFKSNTKGRVLWEIEGRPGGFVAKSHLLPPPSMGKQGRGGEAPAPADSGGPGRWNDDWDGENFLVRVK